MVEKVSVSVHLIKSAYKAACNDWKHRLINEFPELNLNNGFNRGQLLQYESGLVILLTKSTLSGDHTGVCIIPDKENKYDIGYISSSWSTKGVIYNGEPIDVAAILGIK